MRSIKRCLSFVVIGLNVESHVVSAFRRFGVCIPNAVCLDTQLNHDCELVPTNQEGKKELPKRKKVSNHISSSNESHPESRTIRGSHNEVNEPFAKPAILSSLKKSGILDEDQKQNRLQDKNLMSIDWGDDSNSEPMLSADDMRIVNASDEDSDLNEEDSLTSQAAISTCSEGEVNKSEDKSKKVQRLKLLIVLLVIIAIVVLALLMLSNGKTSTQQELKDSISGV